MWRYDYRSVGTRAALSTGVSVISTSELLRPSLAPMKNIDDLQVLAAHPIGDDIRGIGNNKFSRAGQAAGRTHLSLAGKQVDAVQNTPRHRCRALRTVYTDGDSEQLGVSGAGTGHEQRDKRNFI